MSTPVDIGVQRKKFCVKSPHKTVDVDENLQLLICNDADTLIALELIFPGDN